MSEDNVGMRVLAGGLTVAAAQFVIRLNIRKSGDSYSIECDVCNRVVFRTNPGTANMSLEDVLKTMAWAHLH